MRHFDLNMAFETFNSTPAKLARVSPLRASRYRSETFYIRIRVHKPLARIIVRMIKIGRAFLTLIMFLYKEAKENVFFCRLVNPFVGITHV